MPAYVISEVEIRDAQQADVYRALAEASISKDQGRYIVRGAAIEVLEGEPGSGRIVVVEFSTIEHARRWYRRPNTQRL